MAADPSRRTQRDDHAAVHRMARRQDGRTYGKLVPPADVLEAELAERIEKKVRAAVTERILREAGFENQVATAIAAIEKPDGAHWRRASKTYSSKSPTASGATISRQKPRSALEPIQLNCPIELAPNYNSHNQLGDPIAIGIFLNWIPFFRVTLTSFVACL